VTRSQRRIALRKRTASAAGLPDTFAPAGHLAENPNDGKRHVARMTPTSADVARMLDTARTPVPLTVRTQIRGTRRIRNSRGVLVPFETQGYTV
jgi:hypothetical protein